MQDIFTEIINKKYWGTEAPCGSGSTAEYTQQVSTGLAQFLKQHGVHTMFDAPCGDYSWMRSVNFPRGFEYLGGDIVESMIQANQQQYPRMNFRVFDLTQDPIPGVDLLFCRDCLFHFSYEHIQQVFDNIARSSVRYVMTTSYLPGYYQNHDITTGGFRPIRLEAAPFCLPEPVTCIVDGPLGRVQRVMCVWPRKVFERNIVSE